VGICSSSRFPIYADAVGLRTSLRTINHWGKKKPRKKSRRIIWHYVNSSDLIFGQWDYWGSLFLLYAFLCLFFPPSVRVLPSSSEETAFKFFEAPILAVPQTHTVFIVLCCLVLTYFHYKDKVSVMQHVLSLVLTLPSQDVGV
jgi:hypothetical protein